MRDLRTPFGGVKASGLGHEGGYRSIDFYTDQQAVHITLGEVHNPTFGRPGRRQLRRPLLLPTRKPTPSCAEPPPTSRTFGAERLS